MNKTIITLQPPNYYFLTDDIVNDTLQCKIQRISSLIASKNFDVGVCQSSLFSYPFTSILRPNGLKGCGNDFSKPSSSYGISLLGAGKRKSIQALPNGILKETIRRPPRSPIEDQKYFAVGLDEGIQKLRDDIKALEMHHIRVSVTIHPADYACDTVMAYFRVVRHRFPVSSDLLRLLGQIMASDVIYNSEYGIDAIIRSWFLLQWFGDVKEELINLNTTTKNSIVATTRTSVTITQQTLNNVFSHLLRDDDCALRNKLVGQRIVMHGSTCFLWGGMHERVTNVIAHSDMLSPILRLLGNWTDVSWTFEKALISPDFQWRTVSTIE